MRKLSGVRNTNSIKNLPVYPVPEFCSINQYTGVPSLPSQLKGHISELLLGGGDGNVVLSVHQGIVHERVSFFVLTVRVAARIRILLLSEDWDLAVFVDAVANSATILLLYRGCLYAWNIVNNIGRTKFSL
jgi:hypothetical protein